MSDENEKLRAMPEESWELLRRSFETEHRRRCGETDERGLLKARIEKLEKAIREIDTKIGHFAGKPTDDNMPLLSIIIEVANMAREALEEKS